MTIPRAFQYRGETFTDLLQMAEQRANADRIAALCLGSTLDSGGLTADSFWGTIEDVAHDPAIAERLTWMQGEISAAGGAPASADAVEHLLP